MSQVTTWIRSLLSDSHAYSMFQRALTKRPFWPDLVEQFLPEGVSWRVLDIGCGPATFLRARFLPIPASNFVGIDISREYIEAARRDFPEAEFFHGSVKDVSLTERKFNLVVMSGLLHHLNEAEANEVLRFAMEHLSEGGIAISVDVTTFDGQNRFARWMARADRGLNVRSPDSLRKLWTQVLDGETLETKVLSGYLRIPYIHAVCIVRK